MTHNPARNFEKLVGVLAIGCLCLACDGSEPELQGSACTTYICDFDSVEIARQDYQGKFQAIVVRYLRSVKGQSNPEIPAKIVANAPIEVGKAKDLAKEGSVDRTVTDGSQFPKIKNGTITFEELSDIGSSVSGKFYVTFEGDTTRAEITLNGTFSGTLKKL